MADEKPKLCPFNSGIPCEDCRLQVAVKMAVGSPLVGMKEQMMCIFTAQMTLLAGIQGFLQQSLQQSQRRSPPLDLRGGGFTGGGG